MKRLGDTDFPVESIDISAKQSESGKCHVEKACYYPSLKRFHAKVVCPELDYNWNVWADTMKELEETIRKEFDRCDERIRDSINKREMNKPLYFHIGQ